MLNKINAVQDASTIWNDTAPTSTEFTVGSANTNTSGGTYVAYLFAHNDGDGEFGPDGDADIIKCGVFTDSPSGGVVDLGWEPQWVLVKNAEYSGHWFLLDNMRGYTVSGVDDNYLKPSSSGAEATYDFGAITSTGFTYKNDAVGENIYIAIRRGTKVPESGTEVFAVEKTSGTSSPVITTGFPTDLYAFKTTDVAQGAYWSPRLTNTALISSSTAAETSNFNSFDSNTTVPTSVGSTGYVHYNWKRAPGFFDAVAYSGVGTAGRTVSHNLGVAPEMMWVKGRNYVENWGVYHKDVGATKYLMLNQTTAESTYTGAWNDTAPTSSVFTLGGWNAVNESGYNYIAYLFASLDGISKVGSYTGTGSDQNIDCGFTSGARFVLIKRYSSTSPWSVFDSVRGITSSTTDPYLFLNSTAAEATDAQRDLDPYSSGFTLAGNDTDINASGSSYIFYAIA